MDGLCRFLEARGGGRGRVVKLGSLRAGGRDGTLIVASRDLARYVTVPKIAPTLQAALDRWAELAPELAAVYRLLNQGDLEAARPLDPATLAAPLPRAYQWLDGSAYLNHVELVRKARGAEMPPSFWTDPLMYQGGSDVLLGPRDPIRVASEDWGIDFESEVAVVLDDVPMGVSAADARRHIKLVLIVNDISLRNLIPAELAKGFGFLQGKPPTAFAPVAASPDELGPAWDGGKVGLPLVTTLNGKEFGRPNAGADMTFDFPALIAHAARTRPLSAGTIIGSGTVSNKDRSAGSACLAEIRMIETIEQGKPTTPFMRFGDRVRIEMLDAAGHSIFGAIEQVVERYGGP
jgi:fumarylacetoacetate (FAA) hydrolase